MSLADAAFVHSFRRKLRAGDKLRLAWLALGSPALAELAAACEPDGIVLDLQHGLWDRQALEAAVGLAGHRAPVIVRAADLSPMAIATGLDAGASAIMAPLVETAAQARDLVRAGRYPPEGARSGGGVRPLGAGLAGMLAMGREVALGVMIETAAGVAAADAICAVPGLDFIFIGTGDLALSMSGASADEIDVACARVRDAAVRHGLPCGRFTPNAKTARAAYAAGFTIAVAINDIDLARSGFAAALDDARF